MCNGDNSTLRFAGIDWIILEKTEKSALIITADIIGQRGFSDLNRETFWSDSSMRTFLNDEFLSSFTKSDLARIIQVQNQNSDNPWYDTNAGPDTRDSVFLLSIEEAVCKYFGNSSANLKNPSPKQRYWFQKKDANNPKRIAQYRGSSWWWWLRTPGRDNTRMAYIHGDGHLGIQGNGVLNYRSKFTHPETGKNFGGIRPALRLAL